jgi:hypothetical protein
MVDPVPEDHSPQSAPNSSPKLEPRKPKPPEPLRWPAEQAAALEQFRDQAEAALKSSRPRPADVMAMATRLVGSWPHAQGDLGAGKLYLEAIASALREYPESIGKECCNPSTGLACQREMMPTVVSVHDWCRERIKLYRAVLRPRLIAKEVQMPTATRIGSHQSRPSAITPLSEYRSTGAMATGKSRMTSAPAAAARCSGCGATAADWTPCSDARTRWMR